MEEKKNNNNRRILDKYLQQEYTEINNLYIDCIEISLQVKNFEDYLYKKN